MTKVMCLQSDNTPVAMAEVETAAARPSDDLQDPHSKLNLLAKYQQVSRPGIVTTGRGARGLPMHINSSACKQIRALYTAV